MTALDHADRARLVKLLALLASDHLGECAAAGRAATQLLRRHGITWREVLTPTKPVREPLFTTWRATCRELAERAGDLRAWERGFVADLPKFQRISTKQRYVLNEIAKRVLGDREDGQ